MSSLAYNCQFLEKHEVTTTRIMIWGWCKGSMKCFSKNYYTWRISRIWEDSEEDSWVLYLLCMLWSDRISQEIKWSKISREIQKSRWVCTILCWGICMNCSNPSTRYVITSQRITSFFRITPLITKVQESRLSSETIALLGLGAVVTASSRARGASRPGDPALANCSLTRALHCRARVSSALPSSR